MKPLPRSLIHAAGFVCLLLIIFVIGGQVDLHQTDKATGLAGAVRSLFSIFHLDLSLGEYGHQLLQDIGIAITLAVSLNLILGMAGQFSIGHAGFAGIGAYLAVLIAGSWFEPFLRFLTISPFHLSTSAGFSCLLVLGMIAGGLLAALMGFLVGLPTIRLRGDYLAIATLGFGEILAIVYQNFTYKGVQVLGGSVGIGLHGLHVDWRAAVQDAKDFSNPFLERLETYEENTNYFVSAFTVFAIALMTIYIVRNIKYATSGRALLALREDPIASEAVGVPTTRYKVTAFVIGAFLAGIAGALIGHHKPQVGPESFRFGRSIEIVTMVILGGQGSITGSVLAAIGLTLLPELLRNSKDWGVEHLHHWGWSTLENGLKGVDIDKWRLVLYSLFIILAMLFRPNGLFGRYEITDFFAWAWSKIRRTGDRPTGGIGVNTSESGHAARAPTNAPYFEESTSDPAITPNPVPLLAATDVTMQFGGLKAVDSFSLTLHRGELVGLIGPNGAGKTTVFNTLTGVYRPTSGDVVVASHSIVNHFSSFTMVAAIAFGVPLTLAGLAGLVLAIAGIFTKSALLGLYFVLALLLPIGFWMVRPLWARKHRFVGLKPHAISHLGVARTFQNIRLFANLSVLDNVMIAQHAHHRQGIPAAVFRTPAFYHEEEVSREQALGYLDLFNLVPFADERAGSLSYGDQRRLEIARALATRPRVLLLDEPAAGMNPTEKRELMEMIRSLRDRFGMTILLIEHDMKVVMGVCQRIVVLDYGKTIAQGTPEEIRKNPAVIQAYLGASA
jgi:ABC-type branched-subunit amino acid transport system ATPase component/ABC-type branched-subunit amino acid transport system permease subunit